MHAFGLTAGPRRVFPPSRTSCSHGRIRCRLADHFPVREPSGVVLVWPGDRYSRTGYTSMCLLGNMELLVCILISGGSVVVAEFPLVTRVLGRGNLRLEPGRIALLLARLSRLGSRKSNACTKFRTLTGGMLCGDMEIDGVSCDAIFCWLCVPRRRDLITEVCVQGFSTGSAARTMILTHKHDTRGLRVILSQTSSSGTSASVV